MAQKSYFFVSREISEFIVSDSKFIFSRLKIFFLFPQSQFKNILPVFYGNISIKTFLSTLPTDTESKF